MKRVFGFIAAAVLLTGCLCGCGMTGGDSYANMSAYKAGGADISASEVSSIEIHWPAGGVELTVNDGDTVSFSETANREKSEEEQMHYYVNNGKLSIQYSRKRASFSFGLGALLKKELTVSIPRSLVLDDLTVDAASAPIRGTELSAKDALIDSSSGAIVVSFANAENIRIDSASGKIDATVDCDVKSVKADTSSGAIELALQGTDTLTVDSSSGAIKVKAQSANDASFNSASGRIDAAFAETPAKLRMDSSSGSQKLTLPENAGFTAAVDTASGKFTCELPVAMNNKEYVCGSGEAQFTLDTASGDIEIIKG